MCAARLLGKGPLPMHGEYTVDVLRKGLGEFLASWAPAPPATAAPGAREVPLLPAASSRRWCRHGRRGCAPAARSGRSSRR